MNMLELRSPDGCLFIWVQAGIAALAALEYTLYQTDLLDYDVMTDILFKLVHDLLLPVIPDATVNLVQVYQSSCATLRAVYLTQSTCKHCLNRCWIAWRSIRTC